MIYGQYNVRIYRIVQYIYKIKIEKYQLFPTVVLQFRFFSFLDQHISTWIPQRETRHLRGSCLPTKHQLHQTVLGIHATVLSCGTPSHLHRHRAFQEQNIQLSLTSGMKQLCTLVVQQGTDRQSYSKSPCPGHPAPNQSTDCRVLMGWLVMSSCFHLY